MNSYNLENEERKNRLNAFILTFFINAGMLFLFWYITVWTKEENKKKDEVLAGGGFVMNYGTDKNGSGEVFSRNKANKSKELIDSKAANEIASSAKIPKETPPVVPEITKNKVIPTKKIVETPLISSTRESAIKYNEVKPAKTAKKDKIKPLDVKKAVEKLNRPQSTVIDNAALFPIKKVNNSSNGSVGTNTKSGGASDGNTKGIGNQGRPDGRSVDNAEYNKRPSGDGNGGNGGSGGTGSSFSLAGWTWNSKPMVDDDSNDTGIIRFQIKIDSDGDVVDIILKESTVTPNVMKKYKQAVQRTKFRPLTNDNKSPYSSGTVTFKLSPR